jgi:Double zinc ribbon
MNSFYEQFPGAPGSNIDPAPRGFLANLRSIRPVAWVIAFVAFFGMQALFWLVIWPQAHPDDLQKLTEAGRIGMPLVASSILSIYILLIGFIHVDAKRRGMRYVMWTLLAIVIPNAIGIILYFVMRDPMPTPCPKCSRLSAQSFTFCPSCGTELMRTCRVCHKKLGQGWANCAYCGTSVTGQPRSSVPTA